MAKIIFENNNQEFEVNDGDSIIEPCEKVGIPFACGYAGVCGSCVIEVTEGMENLNPPTQEEEDYFGGNVAKERLACQVKLMKGNVKVKF